MVESNTRVNCEFHLLVFWEKNIPLRPQRLANRSMLKHSDLIKEPDSIFVCLVQHHPLLAKAWLTYGTNQMINQNVFIMFSYPPLVAYLIMHSETERCIIASCPTVRQLVHALAKVWISFIVYSDWRYQCDANKMTMRQTSCLTPIDGLSMCDMM